MNLHEYLRSQGFEEEKIQELLPKIKVKTTVVSKGWITAQAGPKIVCLYNETKSRFTNSTIRSL